MQRLCPKIGGIVEIMPPHYGTGDGRDIYRSYIKSLENPVCEGCGENKRYLLTLHHVDGNRKNNVQDNFEVVCFNCHGKRHLKLVEKHWIYCTAALTPRELLHNF